MPAAPLVSCIMPTGRRLNFVRKAVELLNRQTYPTLELVVVDDGPDGCVKELAGLAVPLRYVRLPQRVTIGEARNIACDAARGALIAHWDDDDWQASWRLAYQASVLAAHPGARVTGSSKLFYLERGTGRWWAYAYPGGRPWVAGNTLFYAKETWLRAPFAHTSRGEDTNWLWTTMQLNDVFDAPRRDLVVGLMHPENTLHKDTTNTVWKSIPQAPVELSREDLEFFVGF